MRHYVATVLIFCGTVLALAPTASDYLQERELAQLESRQELVGSHTFIRQPLGEEYRIGAWLLGGGMICLGILGGWQKPRVDSVHTVDVDRDSLRARAAG